jgi:hypothetical protein
MVCKKSSRTFVQPLFLFYNPSCFLKLSASPQPPPKEGEFCSLPKGRAGVGLLFLFSAAKTAGNVKRTE